MRTLWMLMACVAVAGCRKERAAELSKAVPVRVDGGIALNAMSFNVRYENAGDRDSKSWSQRVIGAVRMIRRERPDVIGVQEALHGQVADLWASMPEYEFFGVGRTDGKRAGEYAGIFYLRDRFESDASDCGTFWLSDQPEKTGSRSWGNEIPRIATWIRLTDRSTGRGFYVFNTHWDHRSQPARERSAVLMAERIDGRRHPDQPVVLTGDFNSTESNPGVEFLTGGRVDLAGSVRSWPNPLINPYQRLHPSEKDRRTLHFWTKGREGRLKVDHILVSREARVEAAEILSDDVPEVSDHFPVSVRIVFPKAK